MPVTDRQAAYHHWKLCGHHQNTFDWKHIQSLRCMNFYCGYWYFIGTQFLYNFILKVTLLWIKSLPVQFFQVVIHHNCIFNGFTFEITQHLSSKKTFLKLLQSFCTSQPYTSMERGMSSTSFTTKIFFIIIVRFIIFFQNLLSSQDKP